MDKFDDIWKNRFNEGNPPLDEWNTPDEAVWQSIALHVPPKKEQPKFWLWWLGLGFLIVSLLGVFTYQDIAEENGLVEKIEVTDEPASLLSYNDLSKSVSNIEVEKNIEQTELSSTEIVEKKSVKLNSTLREVKINSEKEKSKIKEKVVAFENKISTLGAETKWESVSTSKRIITPESSKLTKEKPFVGARVKVPGESLVLPLGDQVQPQVRMELVNPLSSKFFPIEERKRSLKFTTLEESNWDFDQRVLRFAFFSGASFWQHRISDSYTTDLSPFDFDYTNSLGWQTGLNLELLINKRWSFKVGLQYESIVSTSGHNSMLNYSQNEEGGAATNDYALNLATPYGLSGAEFRFSRNTDIASENIDLLVDFNSLHKITNWSIPLTARFAPFGNSRRIAPSFEMGIGVNYLANISNSIQSIETNHDAIQYDEKGSSSFTSPDINKWYFDAHVGAGINYYFSSDLSLNVQYNWRRGINPVYALDKYQTKIDRHQFSLGLVKKIR